MRQFQVGDLIYNKEKDYGIGYIYAGGYASDIFKIKYQNGADYILSGDFLNNPLYNEFICNNMNILKLFFP